MPNFLVSEFRRRNPADDRSDADITLGIGDLLAPDVRKQYPDFDAEYNDLDLERRVREKPSLGTELSRQFKGATAGTISTGLAGAGLALRAAERFVPAPLATAAGVLPAFIQQAADQGMPLSRVAFEKAKEQVDIQAQHPATIRTIEEALKSGQYAQYLAGATGQVLPSLIEAGITAIGGAVVGGAAGTAVEPVGGTVVGAGGGLLTGIFGRQAVKRLLRAGVDDALKVELGQLYRGTLRQELSVGAKQLLAEETKRVAQQYGANIATGLNSYLVNAGETYNNLTLDPNNPVDPDQAFNIAITGGVAKAIPDTFLPSYVTSRIFGARVGKPLTDAAKRTIYPKLARFAGEVAKTTGIEGATEGFQEWVDIAADRYAHGKPIDAPLSPEEKSSILNNAVIGGLGGFLVGPIAGVAAAGRAGINDALSAQEQYFADVDDARKEQILAKLVREKAGQKTVEDLADDRTETQAEKNFKAAVDEAVTAKVAEKTEEQRVIDELAAPIEPTEVPPDPVREPVNAANLRLIAQDFVNRLSSIPQLTPVQQQRLGIVRAQLANPSSAQLRNLAAMFDLEVDESVTDMPARFGFVPVQAGVTSSAVIAQPATAPTPALTPAQLAARRAAAATTEVPSAIAEEKIPVTDSLSLVQREPTQPRAEGEVETRITRGEGEGGPQAPAQAQGPVAPVETIKVWHQTTPESAAKIKTEGWKAGESGFLGPATYVSDIPTIQSTRLKGKPSETIEGTVTGPLLEISETAPNTPLEILRKIKGDAADEFYANNPIWIEGKPNWKLLHDEVRRAGYVGISTLLSPGNYRRIAIIEPKAIKPTTGKEAIPSEKAKEEETVLEQPKPAETAPAAPQPVPTAPETVQPNTFPPYPALPEKAVPGSDVFKTHRENVRAWENKVREWLATKSEKKAIIWEEPEREYGKGNVKALTRNIGNPDKPWRVTSYYEREGKYIPAGHQEYSTREAALFEEGRSEGRAPNKFHESMPGTVMTEQEIQGYKTMSDIEDATTLTWYHIGDQSTAALHNKLRGSELLQDFVRDSLTPDGLVAFAKPVEKRHADQLGISAIEVKSATVFDPSSVAIVELPIEKLKLSKDVPNFKSGASEDVGVVSGQELEGKYERRGTAPIVVWERLNGDLEVITGRHRLDLARRTGEKTIPSQVVREANGFTRGMALTFDAEANIRDGQGEVSDYAQYFKDTFISEEEARARGLLARAKGKAGWSLAKAASDDLYALWRNGKLTENQAVTIADAAPGDASAQRIGIKFGLQGKPPEFLSNIIKASRTEAGARGETLDLFGNDDSAMKTMAVRAERAAGFQRDIAEQIRAVQGASKRPEQARKLGVDVKDPEGLSRKIAELKAELVRWDNWPTQPDLVAKVKGESVKTAAPPLELDKPESVEEQKSRLEAEARAETERRERAAAQEREATAKREMLERAARPLGGDLGTAGQGGLFVEPGQQEIFQPPAPAAATPTEPVEKPVQFGSQNKIVTTERADELRQRIKDKLKRTNIGVDPTIFTDAVQLGAYYIEAGFHRFSDWSAKMLEDFGDAIKDHLRSIYETARVTIESPSGESRSGEPTGLQPGLRPPTERIVAARGEQTRQADESVIPADIIKYLDPHQRQGVATALTRLGTGEGFLLADGTGAGKTRQAIAVAHKYAKDGKKVIVVTKAETIKPSWKENTFGGSYKFDSDQMGVKVKLARDGSVRPGEIGITTYENLDKVAARTDEDTLLIFDESHALKNDSQRGRHGIRAIAKADNVMFMSATPADKAEHIYYLARMGVTEGKTIQQALRDLGMTLVTMDKMVKEGTRWVKRSVTFWAEDQRVTDEERNRRFRALFDRLTASGAMLKREISMEGVHVQVLKIGLPPEAHAVQESILRFFDANHIDDLQGLKKAVVLGHQRRQQEPYKVAPTVMLTQRELAAGRQVVIFVSRVNASEVGKWVNVQGLGGETERIREVLMRSEGTAKTMREALEDAGIHDIAEIHGNADQGSLEAMADFQAGKKRVVIATIESGGTGINLDDFIGNRPRSMIVVTAPFDAVGNVQAAGRIWRLKTLSKPNIFYLFGDTDVDDWNADIIGSKMATLGAVVEGQVRRLDISDPELVTTDQYHEQVQQPTGPEPVTAATELPRLEWRPFKTKAGATKFVADATPEFWVWWRANGERDNPEGLRVSKYQDKWQVWSDKPIAPSKPVPSITPQTFTASDLALREGESEEAHRARVEAAARSLGIDPAQQPQLAPLIRLILEKQESLRDEANPQQGFPQLPDWTHISSGPIELDVSLDPVIAASQGRGIAILQHIRQNSRNPFYRSLANLLINAGIDPFVQRFIDGQQASERYGVNFPIDVQGGYVFPGNFVFLTDYVVNAESTVLHEMLHAASVRHIQGRPEFAAQLTALRRMAEKAAGNRYFYGLQDDYEFLSEAYSSPEFQDFLASTRSENRSLWSRFVDFIRNVLGLPPSSTSLLDDVMRTSAVIFLPRQMPIDAIAVQDRMANNLLTTASAPTQIEQYDFTNGTMTYAPAVVDSVEAAEYNRNNSTFAYNPAPPPHDNLDVSNNLNIDAAINNHDADMEAATVAKIPPTSLATRLAAAKGIPLLRFLRQALGLKDTEAVAANVLARAVDKDGNPVQFNPQQRLANFAIGGSSGDKVLIQTYQNTLNAMLCIGKRKAEAAGRIAAAESTRDTLLETFDNDLKNYTDADNLTAQQQRTVRQMLGDLLKNVLRSSRSLGQIEQQLSDLEERAGEPIQARYFGVFQNLFIAGVPIFEMLQSIATDPRIDLNQNIRVIRDQLRATGDSAYEKLLADTDAARALLSTVVAYGKANGKMMAMLEMRRMKAGEDRARINEDLKVLLKAKREDLLRQVRRLPRLGALEERARVAYRQQLKRVLALQRQVERDQMVVELADAALPVWGEAMKENIRQLAVSPQFVFRDGATFVHPQRYDEADTQTSANIRTLHLDSESNPVSKEEIAKYLENASEWLMFREQQAALGNREALTPLYYQIKRERDGIFAHQFYTPQRVKTDRRHFELYFLDAAKGVEALGYGPAREIAKMLREFNARLSGLWPEMLRTHVTASERAETQVLRILNRGHPKRPIDHFKYKDHLLTPAMQLMEQSRGLEEQYVGQPERLRQALQNRVATYLMRTAPDFIADRQAEFFPALFRHIEAVRVASAFLHSKIREKTPVRDPRLRDLKEAEQVRRSTQVGPVTFSRKFNPRVFTNMISAMDLSGWKDFVTGVRRGLPTEEGTASVADLYNAGQGDLVRAWYQPYFFDLIHGDTIQRVFFKELANMPLRSVFDQPVLADGVTRIEAEPALASEAYEFSNGDPIRFFEMLYEAHDGESDKGQYVEEGLKRLALIYQQAHQDNQIFDENPHVDISTLRGLVAPIMSDARIIENLPALWFEYHTFDHQDAYSVTKRAAAQDGFGYQAAPLAYMFQSLRKEIGRDLVKLASVESGILNSNPFTTPKELQSESIKTLGKEEYSRLDKVRDLLGKKGNFLDSMEKGLIDYFKNQNDPIVTMRSGVRLAGFLAGRLVNTPGAAINQFAVLFDPILNFGISPSTVTYVGRNIASQAKDILNALGYAIGVEWFKSNQYEEDFKALGLTDPAAARRMGDAFNVKFPDETKLSRGLRFLSDAQSVALKWPGSTPRGYVLKPLALFQTIAPMANKAVAVNLVRMVEDYALKGVGFFNSNPAAYNDANYKLTAKDIGLTAWDNGTFERLSAYLAGYNMDFDSLARDAKRKLDAGQKTIISNADFLRLNQLALSDVSLESGLLTMPLKAHGSTVMQLVMPLLRWPLARATQIASGRLDPEGRTTAMQIARMTMGVAFVGLTSGIALSLLIEEYNKRLLGKKPNLRPILGGDSPEDTALALTERIARVGTLGAWGELANAAINVGSGQGDSRGFSLDQRIVAANALFTMIQAAQSWIHQGEFDYARVGRPALTAVGGSGALQYAQMANRLTDSNLLGEADFVRRLNVRNILRVAGRQLEMDVKPARGGYEAPSPLTPHITRMEFAVYHQNPTDFRRAYQEAIAEAKELGRSDPARSVQSAFEARHPLKTIFRSKVTQGDYQKLLRTLPDDERADVEEAIRLFNRYAGTIGVSEFTGSVGAPRVELPKLSALDARRLAVRF